MYQELRHGEIPCLSFMKNTNYVMYVGPELTGPELFKLHTLKVDFPVIYLPEVVRGISQEMFEYNFPGFPWPGKLSAEMIYSQIREQLGENLITPDSKMLLRFDGEVLVIFDAKRSLDLAISYVVNSCKRTEPPKFTLSEIRKFSRSRKLYEELRNYLNERGDLYDDSDDIEVEESPILFKTSHNHKSPQNAADEAFEDAMDIAADEVRGAIKNLLLKGFSAAVIRSWLDENIKLSRLRITRQFKILLVDYDKEVKMGPLPKTVFLFYLRHPEGVKFSYLQDHADELLNIYAHVCKNDDPQKMDGSISSLINPFSNSICEKCAAVKKAFMLQVEDSVAKNYYITGIQGGKKGIVLDRNLVQWECEL